MNNKRKNYIICFGIIALVLFLDQALKIWIKTHFAIGDNISLIGDWCKLYFVENVGIAFGLSFGETYGKMILTIFRMVASVAILIFLINRINRGTRLLFLLSISLIFVGAVGNVIDSCFYGLVFSESSTTQVATIFPQGGGYGRFLYGRVVDMFYFPIAEWTWPSWMPLLGGKHAEFFNAIFNVADAAVCTGVALLVIDQFKNDKKKEGAENELDVAKEGSMCEETVQNPEKTPSLDE